MLGDEYLASASDAELLLITTATATAIVAGGYYVAPAAKGYLAVQGGISIAETAVETGVNAAFGGETTAQGVAGSLVKNFAINAATGGIGSKGKWVAKAGAYAGRQAIEIGLDTAYDVGLHNMQAGQAARNNIIGSLLGEAGAVVAKKGLKKFFASPVKVPESAADRATEIHRALSESTQQRTTAAVTETAEGVRVISSSEKRLRPAQRKLLRPNEIEGVGLGHAEVTGVNAARNAGLTPTGTAASRPICPNCDDFLQQNGIQPLSPLKPRRGGQ